MTTTIRSCPKAAIKPLRSSTALRGNGLLQRKCACGGTPGSTGECEACRKKKLQRKAAERSTLNRRQSEVPAIVHEVLHSQGQPLDAQTRAFMEPRFGHDFSNVRVHSGAKAAESARALNAIAYTASNNIVFEGGRYQPAGNYGLRLLAHELAHVVQQQASIGVKDRVGQAGDAYETQADGVANSVMSGKQAETRPDNTTEYSERHIADLMNGRLPHDGTPAIQMQAKSTPTVSSAEKVPGFRQMIEKWVAIDTKIKSPICRAIAHEYVNRPGKIEIPDRVIYGTPYGNKVIPGVHGPTEDRVYNTLMAAMDLKKIGKGDKTTDWSVEWIDGSAAKGKTSAEKGMDLGKFAGEQAISKVIDKRFGVETAAAQTIEKKYVTKQLTHAAYQKGAASLGVLSAESIMTGEMMSSTSIAEAISEPVARWIMKDVLKIGAEVTTRAVPVIGWIWLVYDVADLLISLGEPSESQLSPYRTESAGIVAGVKAYLREKKDAASDKSKSLQPLQIRNLAPDKTAVSKFYR